MSHLTRRAYVSGPYWPVCDQWQNIHVSDTYDTGKMKIKCNLYVTTCNKMGVKDKTIIYLALGSTLSCYICYNLHFAAIHYRRLLLECM